VHGGIQTTLMDDTSFWALLTQFGSLALTTSAEVKFLRPVLQTGSEILTTASVTEIRDSGKVVVVSAKVMQGEQICSTGDFTFTLVPTNKMEKIVHHTFPPDFAEKVKAVAKL
jgi:acyl-coenzyme A thioesterase PaaI-like protein